MSIRGYLHDLTHLGVAPDTPPSDAKYIILTNSVSSLGLLVSLLYFPVNLSVEGNLSVQLVPPVASSVGFSLPLWLNYRRRHWVATTAMSVAGLGTPLAFTLAFGPESGNHFYLLPILSGVTLLYPPRYRTTAGVVVLIGLISFIAIVLWGDHVSPLAPFREDVAQDYHALAVIISAALVAFISYYAHRRTVIVEAQVAARSRELVRTIRELQATQAQMIEAENQAVLARLVAGLLHEINTPLGSIRSAADTMAGAVTRWERVVTQYADPGDPEGQAALRALEVAPQLRDSLHEGTARVSTVVEGLRQFVGLDEAERKPLDVRKGIDGALSLLGPSLQGRIEVIRDYAET
ncbi:MAG: sensor histidine kinase, partial [Vicinamibacteria bacterium]